MAVSRVNSASSKIFNLSPILAFSNLLNSNWPFFKVSRLGFEFGVLGSSWTRERIVGRRESGVEVIK